ncbi:glycosyltransferase family 2 protein [Candidatus Microgenomates bacterium]|nr:glycosyltransferase family 2 protein [Candidatus Microgenomates bacterium]
MKTTLVSFIIPCLDEEQAIGKVIKQIYDVQFTMYKNRVSKEIIVIDNGSTDRSREVAKKSGARVIFEPRKGYGRALRTGLENAKGKYLVFADGDGSYDFGETPKLLKLLYTAQNNHGVSTGRSNNLFNPRGRTTGYDLVIGSRIKGRIKKGAMPFWHRYLGTPILNFLFSLFFKQRVSDVNSGFRTLTKQAFQKLNLKANGMEFASEMIYKAGHKKLKIAEVAISYFPRIGQSKLTPFRDAWRHVKFLLLFSPTFLFLVPGALLFLFGFAVLLWLLPGKQLLLGKYFDLHTMLSAAFAVLIGFQIIFLGLFAKVFALNFLEQQEETTKKLVRGFTLEKGIAVGILVSLVGLAGFVYIVYLWWQTRFGMLDAPRVLIFSLTLVVLGLQIIFSSFFFGIIGKEER